MKFNLAREVRALEIIALTAVTAIAGALLLEGATDLLAYFGLR
jgi:hypothetical protein